MAGHITHKCKIRNPPKGKFDWKRPLEINTCNLEDNTELVYETWFDSGD